MLTLILALAIVVTTLALRSLLERGTYTPTGSFARSAAESDSYRTTAITRS